MVTKSVASEIPGTILILGASAKCHLKKIHFEMQKTMRRISGANQNQRVNAKKQLKKARDERLLHLETGWATHFLGQVQGPTFLMQTRCN